MRPEAGADQPGWAHVAGTSAPPSSLIRTPKRSSAGWGEIFPAIRASPWWKVTARSIRLGGTNENTPWVNAVSGRPIARAKARLANPARTPGRAPTADFRPVDSWHFPHLSSSRCGKRYEWMTV